MRRSIFMSIMVLVILTIGITSSHALPTYVDMDCAMCHISPVVKNFDIPTTSNSLTVPITNFTATDTDSAKSSQAGVIGYLVTESSAMPGASAAGWSGTPLDSYTFTTPGSYTLYAWAKDKIGNVSTELVSASVYIEFINNPPVADAGSVQNPSVGEMVSLNGNGSSDPDGDPLTFQWSLISSPVDSKAAISDPTGVNPTFVADVPGEYLVELVVNDGTVDSTSDILTISTENSPPTAVINLDQQAFNGNTVNLDGSSSSDPDGDSLIFQWSLGSVPDGSAATLSDPAIVTPTFVADVSGEYIVHLIVNDGIQDSALESVSLNVTLADEPSTVDPQVPDEVVTQEEVDPQVPDEGVTQETTDPQVPDEGVTQEEVDPQVPDDEVAQEEDGNSLEDDEDESNQPLDNGLGKENNRGLHKGHYYSNGVRWGRR